MIYHTAIDSIILGDSGCKVSFISLAVLYNEMKISHNCVCVLTNRDVHFSFNDLSIIKPEPFVGLD